MRAQPWSQQGPKAFHGVDVHCMKAISVPIPRVFAPAVTDACMRIALLFQVAINSVCIRVHTRAWGNRRLDQWLDGPLLDVIEPAG
jgi:hypothetical protein